MRHTTSDLFLYAQHSTSLRKNDENVQADYLGSHLATTPGEKCQGQFGKDRQDRQE